MPKIYEYSNLRVFLRDQFAVILEKGGSYRAVARACDVKNPNYFQQVLAGSRNVTVNVAEKLISKVFKLRGDDKEFFLAMVRLDNPKYRDKERILSEMRGLIARNTREQVRDASIFSSWLHAVIFELAITKDFKLTPTNIRERLGHLASGAEIDESLALLVEKKWLIPTDTPGVFKQARINFDSLDGARRLELQQWHLRHLEMAKHRINDDLSDRVFRGTTMAIPKSLFEDFRIKIQKFHSEIEEMVLRSQDKEIVVRLQTTLFKFTR